jgi:hypothetical protein
MATVVGVDEDNGLTSFNGGLGTDTDVGEGIMTGESSFVIGEGINSGSGEGVWMGLLGTTESEGTDNEGEGT